jgi:hypothetical protein
MAWMPWTPKALAEQQIPVVTDAAAGMEAHEDANGGRGRDGAPISASSRSTSRSTSVLERQKRVPRITNGTVFKGQ